MTRIDRLTSMILMLQSYRVVTAEKLAAHFEISVRTVYRDIAAAWGSGCTHRCRGRCGLQSDAGL